MHIFVFPIQENGIFSIQFDVVNTFDAVYVDLQGEYGRKKAALEVVFFNAAVHRIIPTRLTHSLSMTCTARLLQNGVRLLHDHSSR